MKKVISPIEPERIHALNQCSPDTDGQYVLYWIQNSVRTIHNPALEHAAFLSQSLQKPLCCVYLLCEIAQDEKQLTERHAAFLLQGLSDLSDALEKRSISFAVASPPYNAVNAMTRLAEKAAVVVTDIGYLRPAVAARTDVAGKLTVPLVAVEADVCVPVGTVSKKVEYAARTIRPKITRLLSAYLKPLEQVELAFQKQIDMKTWFTEADLEVADLSKSYNIISSLDLDRGSPEVSCFKGGQTHAYQVLEEFISERLPNYGSSRNHPDKQFQSDLSPYLRAGNISPVDIALRVKSKTSGKKSLQESVEPFLEELIVRRELAVNACWYNPNYDDYKKIVPQFAQISLDLHKADKRPKVYSYAQLEAACTDDIYWNAAQLEMIVRGKMHGYMRMYWAKQLIGWIEEPRNAMEVGLRLNNRWELDAVDPNSYVGVIWCFGLHDRAWGERAIWGKVRYMNSAGLKRKFDIDEYVALVDRLVKKEGLPKDIVKIRTEYKAGRSQRTLDNVLKPEKRAPQKTAEKRRRNEGAKERLPRAAKRLKGSNPPR